MSLTGIFGAPVQTMEFYEMIVPGMFDLFFFLVCLFVKGLYVSLSQRFMLHYFTARHSQMNSRLFEAFEARAQEVKDYMAGCGLKYGMACTCGPSCRCANCSEHCKQNRDAAANQNQSNNSTMGYQQDFNSMMGGAQAPQVADNQNINGNNNINNYGNDTMGGMNGYGGNSGNEQIGLDGLGGVEDGFGLAQPQMHMRDGGFGRRASRNPSIISFGGVRGMSVTSEATFGRAMSGLSALSIDWENLEDFDVDIDHSAHINNNAASLGIRKDGETSEGKKFDRENLRTVCTN